MKWSKPKVLGLGSISTGTLKQDDLITSFLGAANSIQLSRVERHSVQMIEGAEDHRSKIEGEHDDEHRGYDLETLIDILQSHTPALCYFGPTEGDGADYGVWPDHDAIEQLVGSSVLIKCNELPPAKASMPGMALVVSDHGNMTLYRKAGRRWVEVWSVV